MNKGKDIVKTKRERKGKKMRFIHAADIHLGAQPEKGLPWAAKRGEEIWETFRRLVAYAEQEKVDFLFIAGDLFHRQPLLKELKEVNYHFSTLTKTKVVLIAGNHDYIKQDSYYRTFQWCDQVTFLKSNGMEHCYFMDENVDIYGGSYYAKEDKNNLYDNLHPADFKRINILLAHGGDVTHRPYSPQRLRETGFDYIAIGHLHKPEILLQDRINQAGCLEPINKNEIGERGFFRGEITKTKSKVSFIPFAARIYQEEIIHVENTDTIASIQKKIVNRIEEHGSENIYRIILTGTRDEVIEFTEEKILKLGNIAKFEDQSQPDYDFKTMYRMNQDNVLGKYIKKYIEKEQLTAVEQKALCYGIRALTFGE